MYVDRKKEINMDNNNIYNIKLNSDYLAKWINYIFIITIVSHIMVFIGSFLSRTGEIGLTVSIIFSVIDSGLSLVIVYCLFKLSVIDKTFGKAALFFALFTIINLLTGFIPEAKLLQLPPLAIAIISTISAPLSLYGEYLEHSGFVNILRGLEDSIVKKWDLLWYVYFPTSILLMITAFISAYYIDKMERIIDLIYPLLLLGSFGALFCFIYKLYVLKKTVNFFKSLEI